MPLTKKTNKESVFTKKEGIVLDLLKYLSIYSEAPRNPLLFLDELSAFRQKSFLDYSKLEFVNNLEAKGYISESTMKEGGYFLTEAGKEEIRRLERKYLRSKVC